MTNIVQLIKNSIIETLDNVLPKAINEADFDKTRQGTVIALPSSGYVTVIVIGKKHTLPTDLTLKIGDKVFVTSPMNNDKLMFINRKVL